MDLVTNKGSPSYSFVHHQMEVLSKSIQPFQTEISQNRQTQKWGKYILMYVVKVKSDYFNITFLFNSLDNNNSEINTCEIAGKS